MAISVFYENIVMPLFYTEAVMVFKLYGIRLSILVPVNMEITLSIVAKARSGMEIPNIVLHLCITDNFIVTSNTVCNLP